MNQGNPEQFEPIEPVDPPRARITKRSLTLSITMLATAVLLAAMPLLPTTYVVRGPGPTFDTLGQMGDEDLITVTGAPTFPSTGQLRLTTVSAAGTPERPVALGRVIWAWFDRDESVYPIESVFAPGQTQEQVNEVNRQEMLSSQETATVAALTEQGFTVPATITVVGVAEGSHATGLVEDGDVITAIGGQDLVTYQQLLGALSALEPGDEVSLRVTRDGEDHDLTIATMTGHGGGAYLGLFLTTEFDFPVDVSLRIEDVGGSSAGMMFALGIIDRLTPEDEAGGKSIAGTGTMSVTGEVGAIGGVGFKMRGALRDGAGWFLAPTANCDEVIGNIPDGLEVFAVETLDQALDAVIAIGKGQTADLATCS